MFYDFLRSYIFYELIKNTTKIGTGEKKIEKKENKNLK